MGGKKKLINERLEGLATIPPWPGRQSNTGNGDPGEGAQKNPCRGGGDGMNAGEKKPGDGRVAPAGVP